MSAAYLEFLKPLLTRLAGRFIIAGLVVGSMQCGGSSFTPDPRSFDRPTAISFGCFGKLRVSDTGEVIDSAQPVTSCRRHQDGVAEGELEPPVYVGFVLQPSSGSVAIVQYPSFESGKTIGGIV